MEDDITFVCPCCHSVLGIDEAGDPTIIEQPDMPTGQHRGLGGLTVVEAEPEWQNRAYYFNQTPMATNPALVPFGSLTQPVPAEPIVDEAIESAIENDLKQRGLK